MSTDNLISLNDDSISLVNCEENYIEARDLLSGPNIYNCYIIECCTGGFFSLIGYERRIAFLRINVGSCAGKCVFLHFCGLHKSA